MFVGIPSGCEPSCPKSVVGCGGSEVRRSYFAANRTCTIGAGRVLFAVTIERAESTRIISARRATPAERRAYEEG